MNYLWKILKKTKKIAIRYSSNPRPSSYPYISGDSFRAIADKLYDETMKLAPETVKKNDIVFVKSNLIMEFFTSIHPQIHAPYILISHNSDQNITEKEAVYANDPKLLHWFAQNVMVEHDKITPIPIGLENKYYCENGITSVFDALRKKDTAKKNRVLFGFNVNTNISERAPALETLRKNASADEIRSRMVQPFYQTHLSSYAFVASPPGNGNDCIRTWEALYLQTIPIVKSSVGNRYFKNIGLPIMTIENWDELADFDEKKLSEHYKNIKERFSCPALFMDYWIQQIQSKKYND